MAQQFDVDVAGGPPPLLNGNDPPGMFCDLQHGPGHYLYDHCKGDVAAEGTLVLIHGFTGSHVYLAELVEQLTLHHNVLRFDLYGRGFTPLPPSGVRMTTGLFVQQLLELLNGLGKERVDLLGYSMGGGIALSFAAHYPEMVRNLCLVAPVGFPSMRRSIPRCLPCLLSLPGVSCLVGSFVTRGLKTRARYASEWVLDTPDDKRRLAVMHDRELCRFPRENWSLVRSCANTLRWFSWGEIGDGISPFKGPALVIWGGDDSTVPLATEEARACLPQAKVVVVPGFGHALPLQRPEIIAKAFNDLSQASV